MEGEKGFREGFSTEMKRTVNILFYSSSKYSKIVFEFFYSSIEDSPSFLPS